MPPRRSNFAQHITIKNVSAKNIGLIGLLINGIPNHTIASVTLENIQMQLPGGGTARAAKKQLAERESAYPEFNMFGRTLPAHGIYARHVRGIAFQDVRMTLLKPDARPATIFVDVEHATPADFASSSLK